MVTSSIGRLVAWDMTNCGVRIRARWIAGVVWSGGSTMEELRSGRFGHRSGGRAVVLGSSIRFADQAFLGAEGRHAFYSGRA